MIKTPNKWSCIPVSFANVLEVELDSIFKYLGHDGSEIIDHTSVDPYKRRGFHFQELVDFCESINYLAITIEVAPCLFAGKAIWSDDKCSTRLAHYLRNYNSVIAGETKEGRKHAIAWKNSTAICPNKGIITLDDIQFESIYLIINRADFKKRNLESSSN